MRSCSSMMRNSPRRTAPRRPGLQVETLEDRCVPACDVFVRDGTLFVLGDETDNVIAVQADNRGLHVTCDGMFAGTFTGIQALFVDAREGGDLFILEEALGAGAIGDTDGEGVPEIIDYFAEAVFFNFGAGDQRFDVAPGADAGAIQMDVANAQTGKRVRFRGFDVEMARIEAGAGADHVRVDNTTGRLSGIHWDISTEAGDDHIDVRSAVTGGTQLWRIDAGSGANATRIIFGDGTGGKTPPQGTRIDADYRSGNGNDRLAVCFAGPLEVEFNLLATTSGGNDAVDVKIQPVAPQGQLPTPNPNPNQPPDGIYRVVASTSAGADIVSLDVAFGPAPRSIAATIDIDTGAGDDLFDSLFVSRVQVLDVSTVTSLGAGNDTSHRLYRLFSFLETPDRSEGTMTYGRIPDRIDLGAGADVLDWSLESTLTFVDVGLVVTGGSGGDTVAVGIQSSDPPQGPKPPRLGFVAGVGIDLGNGDDVLVTDISATATSFTMNEDLKAGAGDDVVSLRALIAARGALWNGVVDLGAGDDSFTPTVVRGTPIAGSPDDVGDGDDPDGPSPPNNPNDPNGPQGPAGFEFRWIVDGGAGNDTLQVFVTLPPRLSKGLISVLGGQGDDILGLSVQGNLPMLNLLLDGGKGFDTCLFASQGVKVENCESSQ